MNKNYEFKYMVSREVLCNYLSRAVTMSHHLITLDPKITDYRKKFILNTGAKYIQRANTCWNPRIEDYDDYSAQKAFIDDLHETDPDVVFEAGVFEVINFNVNNIPIPKETFEAFSLPYENRNFSFDKMCFPSGKYVGFFGSTSAVPDMTQLETQMFFYHRACTYIDAGYEALHLGQVLLMGEDDTNWECWTKLCRMIREYAKTHARRNFVFINAHTAGIVGSDGVLLFDFHADPARPMADPEDVPHEVSEDKPQKCFLVNRQRGDFSTIYGKSIGGKTYSGWECETLPYLVELDNYDGVPNKEILNIPVPEDVRCWGMDEITWFKIQPSWYRAEFMKYAYNWVRNEADGDGFFALPAERVAHWFDETGRGREMYYYAYDPENFELGNNDEAVIKEIFNEN